MWDSVDRKIIGMGAFIAASSAGSGFMMWSAVGFPTEYWWIGVAVAVVTGVLSAAAERSRAGLWAMAITVAVAMAAFAVAVDTSTIGLSVVAIGMIGLGVGTAANRFVFGVVRPIPEPYRKRVRSGW